MSKLPIFQLLILFGYQPLFDAFFFKDFSLPITIKFVNDKYWFSVGESLEIYCKRKDGSHDNLYFTDSQRTVPLNSTNHIVKAVNKSTILLQLYNVTVTGSYNYICQGNKTNKEYLDIGIASFEVGYPPEIKNIQFEYADLKQLRVLMKPRINGTGEYWKTTWKLSENSSGDPMLDECRCLSTPENCVCEDPFNCTISGESCFNPNKTYQFTILGANHYGLLNKTYLISPIPQIVKLKELKKLETSVGVSSLSLSWFWKLQDLWPLNVECKVSYKCHNGVCNDSTVGNEMLIENLEPDTRYTFTLQCKFQESHYWSDVITVQERTVSSALNISIENLQIIDVTCSDVIFSWENPTIDSNIIYNLVTYKAENNPELFVVVMSSQEFKLENLNSSTHYTLSVALCNSNGCSRKKSYVQFTTKRVELSSQLKLTPLSNNLLLVNWAYKSRKRFNFTISGKPHSLEHMNGFILEVPCPKRNSPLKLGIQVISELVNGITNICKRNLKEVTLYQNSGFPTINISLPDRSPSVSDN